MEWIACSILFGTLMGAFIYYLMRAKRLEDKYDIIRNTCFLIISACGWAISLAEVVWRFS